MVCISAGVAGARLCLHAGPRRPVPLRPRLLLTRLRRPDRQGEYLIHIT